MKNWIQNAVNPKTKGALHKTLGVKQGDKISLSKLQAAAMKPGLEGRRARFALNTRKK